MAASSFRKLWCGFGVSDAAVLLQEGVIVKSGDELRSAVAEQLANWACSVVLLTHVIFFPCGSTSALCLLFAVSWVTRFWAIRDCLLIPLLY